MEARRVHDFSRGGARFVPAVVRDAIPVTGSLPLVTIRLRDGAVVEIAETERVAAKWIGELIAALRE